VTCERESLGAQISNCSLSGAIENTGSGEAIQVIVWAEYGKAFQGARTTTFNPLGDVAVGATAEFENDGILVVNPDQYDIRIECAGYDVGRSSELPTRGPTMTSNGPDGGSIKTLTVDPTTPSTIYVATDGGGVFKSTNRGDIWNPANVGLEFSDVLDLVIDPLVPTILYAGTWGGGVYKSTNGGESWIEVNIGLPYKGISSLVIDPVTPATLYAATGGVHKTTNGGGSWHAVNIGLSETDVRTLAIDPTSPETLYAGTYEGAVFKSTNGGESWSKASAGLPSTDISVLAIDATMPEIVWVCFI
jgi:hypothetical protein